MSRRGDLLEFAVLGLLHESPMHGYELRKRLNTALGAFRALSYGSLYPCLRELLGKGWIFESSSVEGDALSGSRRARIVYELTADGKERFQDMAETAGPTAWDDEEFDVHFRALDPEALKAELLPQVTAGKQFLGIASTEAGGGSDIEGVTRCTGTKQPDGSWILDGEKLYISGIKESERMGGADDLYVDPVSIPVNYDYVWVKQ